MIYYWNLAAGVDFGDQATVSDDDSYIMLLAGW